MRMASSIRTWLSDLYGTKSRHSQRGNLSVQLYFKSAILQYLFLVTSTVIWLEFPIVYETPAPENSIPAQVQLYSTAEDQRKILHNNASIYIALKFIL